MAISLGLEDRCSSVPSVDHDGSLAVDLRLAVVGASFVNLAVRLDNASPVTLRSYRKSRPRRDSPAGRSLDRSGEFVEVEPGLRRCVVYLLAELAKDRGFACFWLCPVAGVPGRHRVSGRSSEDRWSSFGYAIYCDVGRHTERPIDLQDRGPGHLQVWRLELELRTGGTASSCVAFKDLLRWNDGARR